jgi:hypothetical protein
MRVSFRFPLGITSTTGSARVGLGAARVEESQLGAGARATSSSEHDGA